MNEVILRAIPGVCVLRVVVVVVVVTLGMLIEYVNLVEAIQRSALANKHTSLTRARKMMRIRSLASPLVWLKVVL